MNFQRLQKLESKDTYLDIAIKRAKLRVEHLRPTLPRTMKYLDKRKRLTQTFITALSGTLNRHFLRVLDSYPRIDDLPSFYRTLISLDFSVPQLKKSLAALKWIMQKLDEFAGVYQKKVFGSREKETIDKHKREYIGRVNSLIKQITDEMNYLETFRKTSKTYPDVKDMNTVCLFGFPNVGKSTLLSQMTPANPKIAAYVFTTTTINAGYIKHGYQNIQILDTPGTLDRFEQMNTLERQAYLAVKELSDLIVYVFDPTQQSLGKQKQVDLFLRIRDEMKQPVIIFMTKRDLLDESKYQKAMKYITTKMSTDVFDSVDELKNYVISFERKVRLQEQKQN